jgi:trehalose synthase
MYGTLAISHRALDDLAEIAGRDTVDELRSLARPIEGLRILNLSVTGFGTGTAELLNSSVAFMNDLGLDAHWQVVRASSEIAQIQREMYQGLGGLPVEWTQGKTDAWLRDARMNARLLTETFDVVIVHDPQPLAIRSFVPPSDTRWVMHSHIDLSSAIDAVWMRLREHVEKYDLAIFPSLSFCRPDITIPKRVVPPAIDPTSARNMPLPPDLIENVLRQYGIDPARPIVCQVSPCDAASDLVGVVDAWWRVRETRPGVQLVFVLTTEAADAAGRASYDEIARLCHDEADAFVVSGNEIGNVEVNVFQTAASVVVQKGLRKGFGLWVSDALWKRRPCVVGPAPGLLEQVIDGETGLVAHSSEELASAITRLLEDRATAEKYGENGRRHVAERFLITRYLKDYLGILTELHRTA